MHKRLSPPAARRIKGSSSAVKRHRPQRSQPHSQVRLQFFRTRQLVRQGYGLPPGRALVLCMLHSDIKNLTHDMLHKQTLTTRACCGSRKQPGRKAHWSLHKHLGNTVVSNEWRKQESGPALVFPAPCMCAAGAQTPSPASRLPRHALASWLRALHSTGCCPSPQRLALRPLLRQLAAGHHALNVPAKMFHWIALGSAGADELSPPPNPDHTGRLAAVFS